MLVFVCLYCVLFVLCVVCGLLIAEAVCRMVLVCCSRSRWLSGCDLRVCWWHSYGWLLRSHCRFACGVNWYTYGLWGNCIFGLSFSANVDSCCCFSVFLFNLQVPFRAGLCWHCLCPGSFLLVVSFPFHSIRVSVQFRFTWLSSLNGFQFPRCNFHLSQACVVRSFGCNFQVLFVVRCFFSLDV